MSKRVVWVVEWIPWREKKRGYVPMFGESMFLSRARAREAAKKKLNYSTGKVRVAKYISEDEAHAK